MAETYPDTTIRPYRPGDELGILKTFNLVFREVCGAGYVDRSLEFWRWEYAENPAGHRMSLAVARDGTVAAQFAGVPQRVSTSFGELTFAHMVDSFVHPDFRKGLKKPGLFIETALPCFADCEARGDAVLYGYPVVTAERIGHRYLSYRRLRVLDYLCRDAAEGSVALPGDLVLERVASFPADTDALFAICAREKRCFVRRDRTYLEWRYVRYPKSPYEAWIARRGGVLCGLAVLHPFHELVPGACSIVDWLVPESDRAAQDALLAKATERARHHGRKCVMAVFADPAPETTLLRSVGFSVVPSATYLQRILNERTYDRRLTGEWLAAHWWYTLGDSDLA